MYHTILLAKSKTKITQFELFIVEIWCLQYFALMFNNNNRGVDDHFQAKFTFFLSVIQDR